ncbi:MAG: DUF4827 domain-containing protein [Bacteroidaceae bacterium]|nr:DUF4827 domain-containing protein [Bacteroidaceae bacterium]
MKQLTANIILLLVLTATVLSACSDDETYAEKKEKERDAIASFINRDVALMYDGDTALYVGKINVISEDQFQAQDSTTNLERNEYVLFGNNGVYMQIVRKGVGEKLQSGQSKRVIARYLEFNILADSIQTRNDILYYSTTPDIIDITNSYGTFTASFNIDNGGGAMYRTYNSTSVPSGWLVPFTYINIGRQIYEDDEISKVRLIVPHSQGHSLANQYVYPCFYEITFQQMRD